MSNDAQARVSRKLSVCFLHDSPKYLSVLLYEKFFRNMGITPDDVHLWSYAAPDMMKTWSETAQMPISSIPCDPEPPRIPLEERLAEPVVPVRKPYQNRDGQPSYVVNGITNRFRGVTKPVSDFDIIVFGHAQFARLADHSYLQEIVERNPDVLVCNVFGRVYDRDTLLRLRAQRSLLEMMIRNTSPLLKQAMRPSGACYPDLLDMMRPFCAIEIQALLRLQRVGLTEPYWERTHAVRMLFLAGFLLHRAEGGPIITKAGENLIKHLHPSAYDPGFFDRWELWMSDPEAHIVQYRRWIRTWSGRLRRYQAKIWKAGRPQDAVDVVSAEIRNRVRIGEIFTRSEIAEDLYREYPDLGMVRCFYDIVDEEMNKTIHEGHLIMTMTQKGHEIYGPPHHAQALMTRALQDYP